MRKLLISGLVVVVAIYGLVALVGCGGGTTTTTVAPTGTTVAPTGTTVARRVLHSRLPRPRRRQRSHRSTRR